MAKHLTAETMKRPVIGTIRAVEIEEIDGRPQPVLYFVGRKRGVILTPDDYKHIKQVLGPHAEIERVFAMH